MGKSKQLATMLTDAPAALDTLDELAAALGDDANFATTVTNSIATKLPITDPAIDMGTNKKIRFTGGIGEIGSVPGFQATNDANDGLRSMGLRGTTLRFATGDDERLRIEDNAVGIGTDAPSTTDSGYNKGALHVHNASGSGAQVRWTNSTTGTGTSDGFMISKWSDKNTYMTNFDDGAKTVFTQSNSSGTLVADSLVLDGNGNIGIGISPATTAGVNYARLVIDSDSDTYPKSLEINATNPAGPNFAISSYSDGSGSYYLLGANLSYQTNGNFAWETNGENMAGLAIDSRAGHGLTFIDSYWDGSSAYVPAEIGKVHTSIDSRADIIVDATGLAGDGGTNANAFFNAKAKGYYYAGLEILSNDGHVGGWIGHHNGSSTARNLQARVGGTGINASDYQAIYIDYLGRVTHPSRPSFMVRGFNSHQYINSVQSAEDSRLRGWKHIETNRGSHFDNSTGKFTCPVTGDYIFYCNVMYTNPNTMDFHLGFKKNGSVVTYSNDHNGGGSAQGHSWNGCTLTVSGYFNANDYVGFGIYGGGSTSTTYLYGNTNYCIMGGYLL